MMGKWQLEVGAFAFVGPYNTFWIERFYSQHFKSLYGKKIGGEAEFRHLLSKTEWLPEILLIGNFIADRAGIISLCREYGINTVHCEDGFFPHYETMHVDPLGFSWESSLPRMVFRQVSSSERKLASKARSTWLKFRTQELPALVKKPFVLWPLQLLKDKVNQWDLNVDCWESLLAHFRECLPEPYQLVVRDHPRAVYNQKLVDFIRRLPNTIYLPDRDMDLKVLLNECSAVGGANSSVLYEARLMFNKPVYAYARGWFTNHEELFFPVHPVIEPRKLMRLEFVEDNSKMQTERLIDYTDWFLAQMLSRQIDRCTAENDRDKFRDWILKRSYHSYLEHGEAIFDPEPEILY